MKRFTTIIIHLGQDEACFYSSYKLELNSTRGETDNAGLLDDQKGKTRDQYYTVDKAIRRKMVTISSADGQREGRKLNE